MGTIPVVLAFLLIAAPSEGASRSGHVEVDGARIYFEQQGSGLPVVLLHGGINTFETTFARLTAELARKYRVVGVEQVGHGHSPDTKRPYSYTEMADHTAAVLKHLGIERADLIGWSDGGIIALLMAIRHPELVRRIISSGANLRLDGMTPKAIQWMKEFSADDKAFVRLREAYQRTSPDGPGHWPVMVEKDRALWLTPIVIEKDKLARVSAPTMVIAGDQDTVLVEHSVEIFRALPRAQLCILPDTGHRTFEPRADWLLPIISAFLDAPEKPAG